MNENVFEEIVVRQRDTRRYLSVGEVQSIITGELENKLAGLGVSVNSIYFDSEEGIILVSVSQKN